MFKREFMPVMGDAMRHAGDASNTAALALTAVKYQVHCSEPCAVPALHSTYRCM